MKFETTDKLKELDMKHIGAASTKLRSAQRDASEGRLRLLTPRPCSTHRRIGLHEKLIREIFAQRANGQAANASCEFQPALAQLCLEFHGATRCNFRFTIMQLLSNDTQYIATNAAQPDWQLCCCLLTQVEQRKSTSQLHPSCIPSL